VLILLCDISEPMEAICSGRIHEKQEPPMTAEPVPRRRERYTVEWTDAVSTADAHNESWLARTQRAEIAVLSPAE
jgi:hypothetical protein